MSYRLPAAPLENISLQWETRTTITQWNQVHSEVSGWNTFLGVTFHYLRSALVHGCVYETMLVSFMEMLDVHLCSPCGRNRSPINTFVFVHQLLAVTSAGVSVSSIVWLYDIIYCLSNNNSQPKLCHAAQTSDSKAGESEFCWAVQSRL